MKFKNITPRRIAILTAAAISGFVLLLALCLNYLFGLRHNVLNNLLLFVLTLIVSYYILVFVLRRYIFRKLKLIYKSIHDFRVGKINKSTEREIDLNSNVFLKVEDEVKEWTELREKELNELQTLESYRRQYIGNVSHELKTPIFNIQGYIHTLLDGGLKDDNINIKYLRRAGQNLDRLITIVEDLDVITRLESGDIILDRRPFDIRQLVENIFEDLELSASKKDITLRFKDGASNNFTVSADPDAIRTVLMNLITNSIRYGRKGGVTSIGLYDMDHHIMVEVSDNGIGIENVHLRHLFDRFYRVDESRSRSDGGSGLGLSIVKHILEAHQQPIHVRSTPGVGTTFSFTLPKEAE